MTPLYNSYRTYVKSRFGKPVLKIPLNGGFSCPNRDGVKSTGGCAFCDNRAFSPVAATHSRAVVDQLTKSINASSTQYNAFIAYLQPFSNTYAPLDQLRAIYEPIIAVPGVVGLAIGTRPDCITPETAAYLGDLASRTYLSIEIGLQSGSNDTLLRNNRNHSYEDFANTIELLSPTPCDIVVHIMLGLPGDNEATMIETAVKIAALPVHGVKIHQLMIIRDTLVEQWYTNGAVKPLALEEYARLTGTFLGHLRPDQHIHRIMADSTPAQGLVAPLWSSEKQQSVNAIRAYMKKHDLFQGKYYTGTHTGM